MTSPDLPVTGPIAPDRVSAVVDDALGGDDMTELLGRLARREVSPAELRAAAVERAHRANERLNAVAAWVDDAWVPDVEAPADAPFAGIPTLIKDNEDLVGLPSRQGSWAVADNQAAASWPWSRQFLSMGVAPIAKTTLPEFGLTASTESSRFGATRNPWDTARSAGGSSGGSAALVAAGVVPIAHANDGGGSIRIPAACCGLVGLKPTRNRTIDLAERQSLPVHITSQGVVTRTVRDTARYYAEAERRFADPALPPIGHVEGPGTDRLRVGLVLGSIRGLPTSPEVVGAVRATGELLAAMGHHVEEVPVPVDESFGPDFLRYWAFIAWLLKTAGGRLYGPGFDGSRTEILTTGLARNFRREAERLPATLRRLRRLSRHHDRGFERHDLLVTPVLAQAPPPIGHLGPDVDVRTHLVRLLRFTTFTPVQNVSGGPGLSLPLGRTATGLPIGVHLIAPHGHERRLLQVGYALEEAAPWPLTPSP